MNNKHFGCLALGLFIMLMGHWTNASYKKLRLARDAEEMSRTAFDGAVFARSAEQRKMVILKNNTIDSREYLNQWEPYIRQVKNAQFGESFPFSESIIGISSDNSIFISFPDCPLDNLQLDTRIAGKLPSRSANQFKVFT